MPVIRLISTVYRNVSCVWLIHIYSNCKHLHCWELKCVVGIFLGGFGGDSNKMVVLRVIAEKMKICSYLHVRNNPYPQGVSERLDQFQVHAQ